MSQEPPVPVATRRVPSRRRGQAILVLGPCYSMAMAVLGTFLDGWVAWGVGISGVLAGGMLAALGYYIVRLADEENAPR